MPLPTIADVYRVAIDYGNAANLLTATNVIHVRAPASDETAVFNALNARVTTEMWDPCTNQLTTNEVVVTKLDGTPDGIVFAGGSLSGEWRTDFGSDDFMPQGCALIKLSSSATGRSGRGRVYLPFISELKQSGGSVDPTSVTTCTSAWNDFIGNLGEMDGVFVCVASYLHSTSSDVVASRCESAIATQRRRNKR